MSDLLGDRPVLDAGGDDKQLTGAQQQRLGILHLDAEFTVPTQEQLVLVVVMPGELTFEPGDAQNGVVGHNEIGKLPRAPERRDGV